MFPDSLSRQQVQAASTLPAVFAGVWPFDSDSGTKMDIYVKACGRHDGRVNAFLESRKVGFWDRRLLDWLDFLAGAKRNRCGRLRTAPGRSGGFGPELSSSLQHVCS